MASACEGCILPFKCGAQSREQAWWQLQYSIYIVDCPCCRIEQYEERSCAVLSRSPSNRSSHQCVRSIVHSEQSWLVR
jgi:hypothetical protein